MLIAFTGHKGHGKGEAAKTLIANGYVNMKFAGALKDMMYALGLSDEEIEGRLKEKPCPLLCGATPRHAMQTLGTDWGRHLIHPDLWVNTLKRRVIKLIGHRDVVIDDCRFHNEVDTIKELGGYVVKVLNPRVPIDLTHQSEREISELSYDGLIINGGTKDDLAWNVEFVINEITGGQ